MVGKSTPITTEISAAFGQLRCDRDMQALLKAYEELKPARFDKHTEAAWARTRPNVGDAIRMLRDRFVPAGDPAVQVVARDITVKGAAGALPARLYIPPVEGPLPVVLYFHGGGWATGSIESDDASARGIAARAQAAVISVDYRLAPEHRFPAAWDDALAAYRWVLEHAVNFHCDASRIALAGEGAGGTLALATALAARDHDLHRPAHVLAISPVTQTSTNTLSYVENAVTRSLSRNMMVWFFERLVLRREDLKDPRLQLVDADLADLPPVTLITARLDPLRSDSQRLRDALARANVAVTWRDYQGVTHGFFGAGALVDKARQAQEFAGGQLAAALAAPAQVESRAGRMRELAEVLRDLLPTLQTAPRPVPARASVLTRQPG